MVTVLPVTSDWWIKWILQWEPLVNFSVLLVGLLLETFEKIEAVTQEIMDGVIEGAKEAKLKVADLTKQAADGIVEGTKQARSEISDIASNVAEMAIKAGDIAVKMVKDVLKRFAVEDKNDIDKRKNEQEQS